ncbi:AraC family transcriptional regulator [Microbacterium sp. RD1]|uniref:AraC family transcriptional regulator n=1 Tax=Microbacterium sp. RD1 TaxID=3457313 RepID=UPI003FA60DA8
MNEFDGGSARARIAVAPPESIAESATDPIGRHLTVLAAGTERFDAPREVDRPSGAGFVIVCATLGGSGWVRLSGTTHRLGPGSVFMLPPAEAHAYGTAALPWRISWMDLTGIDLDDLMSASGASVTNPVLVPRDFVAFVDALERLIGSLESDDPRGRSREASGRAWRALAALAADRLRPGRPEPVDIAIEWITAHWNRRITVAATAAASGLSVARLQAGLREQTGGGVIAYQTSLRMARARRLLDGSADQVSQIARAVGYDDPYYFSRQFKRTHGVSPSEFRSRPRP